MQSKNITFKVQRAKTQIKRENPQERKFSDMEKSSHRGSARKGGYSLLSASVQERMKSAREEAAWGPQGLS